VKARVFKPGIAAGFTTGSKFVIIDSLQNGIGYAYYLGAWDRLPDFNALEPHETGKVYNIDLDEFEDLADQFGILFTGTLNIEKSGIYTFHLTSNDGSKLFIDNTLVVDTDGLHSFSGKSGTINLSAGQHKIRLPYFQAGGGKGLQLEYEGPGIEKQRLPADVLLFQRGD
jgi:hypothetical protein